MALGWQTARRVACRLHHVSRSEAGLLRRASLSSALNFRAQLMNCRYFTVIPNTAPTTDTARLKVICGEPMDERFTILTRL